MIILGIDTVFHSACVSVIKDEKILCSIVNKTPISGSREKLIDFAFTNVNVIGTLVESALEKAKMSMDQVSLIAVTNNGSLLSSVIIGVAAANTLASLYDIPVIGVDHHEAHLYSNWLENENKKFNFPVLVFSASGAHTSLCVIFSENDDYKEINSSTGMINSNTKKPNFMGIGTLFSDVSLFLKLRKINEVGNDGLLVSDLAKNGNSMMYDFFKDYPDKESDFWDFVKLKAYIINSIKTVLKNNGYEKKVTCDIAASFEIFIAKLVTSKLLRVPVKHKINEVHLAGGVASNDTLREYINAELSKRNITLRCPQKKYCIDNAVMIANLGRMKFKNSKNYKKRSINVESDLKLDKIAIDQYFK